MLAAARQNSQSGGMSSPPPPMMPQAAGHTSQGAASGMLLTTVSSSNSINNNNHTGSGVNAGANGNATIGVMGSGGGLLSQASDEDILADGICTECAECAECAAKQLQQETGNALPNTSLIYYLPFFDNQVFASA